MARNSPPPVALFYGNQALQVDEAAQRLEDAVLGDGPRDFALQRFDAADLLKAGAAEAVAEGIAAIELACGTPPFLCERWVVRVDHVEAVRISERAAHNLQRAIRDLRLFGTEWEGQRVWALDDDLTPTDPRDGGATPLPWVEQVTSRAGSPPVLHLRADSAGERFLLAHGGERRIVNLRDFLRARLKGRFSFAEAADAADEGEAPASGGGNRLHQVLEGVAANPQPGLHLVLTATATRESDLSRPLLTAVKKAGRIERFVTYDDYNPVDFVLRGGRERGLELTRSQAAQVIQLAGNDLARLSHELDKLALAFPEGATPDERELLQLVGGGRNATVFLIAERLGAKDLAGALDVLEHFLGEHPHEHPILVGVLARQVRQWLHVHTLQRLQIPESDWPSQLKLHPFIAKKVAANAGRFAAPELERMLRALAGLDVAAKLHGHLTGALFREFVHAVCAEGFRRGEGHLGTRLAALIADA